MAEEIKDLGGLVNKDIAFSKLPQGAIFDSQNFRITSDDGNTSAARETIKGTKAIAGIPLSPCISTLDFNATVLSNILIQGLSYDLTFAIYGNAIIPALTFTYSSVQNLISSVATYINTTPDFQNNQVTAVADLANNKITLIAQNCAEVTIESFVLTGGGVGISSYPYTLNDEECELDPNDYTTNNGYPASASGLYWTRSASGNFSITSNKGIGITDYAGFGVDQTARRIELTANGVSIVDEILYSGNKAAENNQLNNTLYQYFPSGIYNFETSFYVKKDSGVTGSVKFYLDLGTTIDQTADPGLTYETVDGKTLILINQYALGIGTDDDALNSTGNPNNFTWNTAASLFNTSGVLPVLGVGTPAFNIVVRFQADKLAGPPNFNTTFYLDHVKVTGPTIDLAGLITVNSVIGQSLAGYIIGWTALRDDIYLFTTDGTYDPDDPSTWGGPSIPATNGQIWRFSYNKAGDYGDPNNYSLTLVYSNPGLNFTIYRPIANPGMIESRYENNLIQKIYWTDNYNVPRQINVADPNVANLTVEELNLQPSLSMDLPVITQILDGGDLLVGVYQVAYRLKNINGSETRFSRTSKFVPIIDAAESTANVITYFPQGAEFVPITDADKSIKVVVENLDTDYDTIEFVLIYFSSSALEPTIDIVKEAFIPVSGRVEVIITGGEEKIPVTTDEFTAFNTYIKRAKTLAAKKQTLFLGNVTTADQYIDFDARAYRFPINSASTAIKDNATINTYTLDATSNFQITEINSIPVTSFDIPEDYDCIQSYQDQGPEADSNLLYLPNSNILGGAGPNVSYTFFTENIKLDNKYDDLSLPSGSSYGPYVTPDTNAVISFNSVDRQYTAEGTSLSNTASPYVYDLYVGYRRDEMYRFGIVFFDELDNPTYVRWIGDIRMPHIWMPDTTANAADPNPISPTRSRIGNSFNADFTSDIIYYDDNTNQIYGKPLGVKFTIDFSSVADKYKKAMIVRTPLKQSDRHILGQGIFTPTYKTSGTTADGDHVFTNNPYPGNYAFTLYNDIWYDCWTLHSPEFLFSEFPGLGSDKIDVLGLLYTTDFNYLGVNTTGNTYGSGNQDAWRDSSGNLDTLYSGFKIKTYKRLENYTAVGTVLDNPRSVKLSNSNNPYPVILAKLLNNEINSNPTRDHNSTNNITTLGAGSGGFATPRTVNNCSPRDMTTTGLLAVAGGSPAGASYNNKCLFVQLRSNEAGELATYITQDGWNARLNHFFHLYTANYIRDVASPFGGQDYFARSNSEYVSCKGLIDISNKTNPIVTKVYGGDTVVSILDHVLGFPDRYLDPEFAGNTLDLFHSIAFFPVETNIAVDYRQNAKGVFEHGTRVPNRIPNTVLAYPVDKFDEWSNYPAIETDEYYYVYPVFNYTDSKEIYRYFPQPALVKVPTTFDCRVWKSEPKIDGELVESWSFFKPSAFLDVESAYGPLNNLIVFQDKLYYFQDRGFGVLQVAAQQVLNNPNSDLSELVLGSSGILERYDYVSTKTGTKHQFSMSVSDYSLIWFDTLARKVYRYKPGALEPLTDIKGYSTFIYNRTGGNFQIFDNPYIGKGIHSTYDFRHNEFFMTFIDRDDITNDVTFEYTLVYNDMFDGFVGRYTHYPKVYINDKVNIFSPKPDFGGAYDFIYIHNYGEYGKFYGSRLWEPSKLSFVVNSNPTIEKVFTNLEIVAESFSPNLTGDKNYDSLSAIDYTDFFETFRVYNNYQNTNVLPTNGFSRRHKTIWNMKIPSDRVLDVNQNIFDTVNLAPDRPAITRRLKDKWFVVDLVYNPQSRVGLNKFVIHTAKAIYSVNSR